MRGQLLVRTLDASVIVVVTIAVMLVGILGWTARHLDRTALRTEAEIIRSELQPDISAFRQALASAAVDPQGWVADDAQRRAFFPRMQIATGRVRSRIDTLLDDRATGETLARARKELPRLDPAHSRVDFVMLGAPGDETLALLALAPASAGETPALAIKLIDVTELATRLERFSIHLDPVRRPEARAGESDGQIRLEDYAGRAVARVSWRSDRVSGVFSTLVFPALAAVLLIGLAALLVLRQSWEAARKGFQADLDAVESLAFTDSLTSLPNRRALFEHLRKVAPAITEFTPITVMMMDLDGFKLINDQIGHQAGDKVLALAAGVLRSELAQGAFIARLGGDEFVAVAPGEISGKALHELHRHLVEVLAEKTRSGGGYSVGLSIGAACSLGNPGDGEDLLRLADIAVYAAKAGGRGQALSYDPDMLREKFYRRTIERELRAALMTGELFLAHQPIVDALSNRITGYESLVRWRHSVRGTLMPGAFIPVAEQSDLIIGIGDYVLDRALMELGPLKDCRISVNAASRELMAPNFAEKVKRALKKHDVAPERLCIEITETSLINDRDRVIEVMADLRGIGVIFAIDDFGVGYSSLNYLLKFKFEVLKIDRDFITGLDDNPEAPMIVTSIVTLARSLGMQVTGEGIETAAQQRFLASAGCNTLQGYLFGKPQSLAEMRLAASDRTLKLAPASQAA